MHSKVPDPRPDGRERLLRAIERNTPVELQIRRRDGEVLVVKTRLIRAAEDGVEADWPTSIGLDVPIVEGLKVDAYFLLDDEILSFATEVVEIRRTIELNAAKRIVGVVLRWPTSVEKGQRRNDHRVVVVNERMTLMVAPATDLDGAIACPIDAGLLECAVADISIGGTALLLPRTHADRARINDLWFAELPIPGDASIPLLMEVRQRRPIPRSDLVRIGFKFKPFPDARHFQRYQQSIQRHLVRLERQRLQSAA